MVVDLHIDWTWQAENSAGTFDELYKAMEEAGNLDSPDEMQKSDITFAYRLHIDKYSLLEWYELLFLELTRFSVSLLCHARSRFPLIFMNGTYSQDLARLAAKCQDKPALGSCTELEVHLGIEGFSGMPALFVVLRYLKQRQCKVKCTIRGDYIGVCRSACAHKSPDDISTTAHFEADMQALFAVDWASLSRSVHELNIEVRLDSLCAHHRVALDARLHSLTSTHASISDVSMSRYAKITIHTSARYLAHRAAKLQSRLVASWRCDDSDNMIAWPSTDMYDLAIDTHFWVDVLRPLRIGEWQDVGVSLGHWVHAKCGREVQGTLAEHFRGAVKSVINHALAHAPIAHLLATSKSMGWRMVPHGDRSNYTGSTAPASQLIESRSEASEVLLSRGQEAIEKALARARDDSRINIHGIDSRHWIDHLEYESSAEESGGKDEEDEGSDDEEWTDDA